jgi:hypothetical protein
MPTAGRLLQQLLCLWLLLLLGGVQAGQVATDPAAGVLQRLLHALNPAFASCCL